MEKFCIKHQQWGGLCYQCDIELLQSQLAAKEAELEQVQMKLNMQYEVNGDTIRKLVIERKRADDNENALELACEEIAGVDGMTIDYFRNEVRKAQEE